MKKNEVYMMVDFSDDPREHEDMKNWLKDFLKAFDVKGEGKFVVEVNKKDNDIYLVPTIDVDNGCKKAEITHIRKKPTKKGLQYKASFSTRKFTKHTIYQENLDGNLGPRIFIYNNSLKNS